MIGIRSAISIRARGLRPHLEAVYMTAPRSVRQTTKKVLAEKGPSIHDGKVRTLCGDVVRGGEISDRFGKFFSIERFDQEPIHAGLEAGVAIFHQRVGGE